MRVRSSRDGFCERLNPSSECGRRWTLMASFRRLARHRLSRHAIRYNEESRADSTVVLVRPMSASSRSSSSRSSLYWRRRSNTRTIPVSGASGIFHQRTSERDSDRALDGAFMVKVGLEMVLPQGMFHLRIGAKQHLAAGAHRAVVNVPSDLCIIPAAGTQAREGPPSVRLEDVPRANFPPGFFMRSLRR